MATSGTRTFNPQFSDLMTEAFSRCLIRPQSIVQDHIDEAVRKGNLALITFANRTQMQFQIQAVSLDLEAEEPTYVLPVGALEVWSMVHRRDGVDTPIWPMARTSYQRIPSKEHEGRPFNYFTERGKTGNGQRTVTFWPTPDRDTDTAELWCLMRPEDITGLPEEIGVAWEWFDALAGEVAWRLAGSFAPELKADLQNDAEKAYTMAKRADRERAPLRLRMRGYTRGRRF